MPDRHQLGHPRLRLPFAGPASSQPASRPARMRAGRSPPTIAALSLVSGAGRNPSGRTLPRDSAGRGGRRRAAPGPREETPPVTRGRLGGSAAGGPGDGRVSSLRAFRCLAAFCWHSGIVRWRPVRKLALTLSSGLRGTTMIKDPYQDLPAAQRRRVVFWALLRALLSTTVLVVLYSVLPLDEPWNGDTAVRILIGLLVFAGITVWQVKAIAGSRYPAVKAIEALGLIVPLYLLLFASTYF